MPNPAPPVTFHDQQTIDSVFDTRTGPRLLLVDRDPAERARLRSGLEPRFVVGEASSAQEALHRLEERWFQFILTDYELGEQTGVWLLQQVRTSQPHMRRAMMAAVGVPRCFSLYDEGLFWLFLAKPVDPDYFAGFVGFRNPK